MAKRKRQTTRKTVALARRLRREMTPPEIALWQALRSRPDDYKFRRQHPVGPYSADFYWPKRKLIIEVDSIVHEMDDNPARDARRDAWLAGRGYRILRIDAKEVMENLEGVLEFILAS